MENHNRIIVAGTDTDIGKTYISATIMEQLDYDNSIYIKPIQTGFPEYSDEEYVSHFTKCNSKTLLKFKNPASPHLCAKIENRPIDTDQLIKDIKILSLNYKNSVLELAGGLLVPITETYTNLDLINNITFNKIYLVSRPNLGTLNHTLLSIQALNSIGVKNESIIVVMNFAKKSHIDYIIEENISYISKIVTVIVVKNGQKEIKY